MQEIVLPMGTPPEQPGRRKNKAHKAPHHRYKHRDVNHGRRSFASGVNFYKLAWLFFIGCAFGVLFETMYVWATTGHYMRRSGMLYGPFNQVYGFGAILFVGLLYPLRKKNGLVIFGASMLLGLVFEYACSWVQEVVFHSTSWNYSEMPFNIGGRTNLLYGVGWGLLGLVFMTHTWPFISEMIERIPNKMGKPMTIIIAVALVLDMGLSGAAVYRMSARDEGKPATNVVTQWLDKTYPNAVMAEKYPSMTTNAVRDAAKPSADASDGEKPAASTTEGVMPQALKITTILPEFCFICPSGAGNSG